MRLRATHHVSQDDRAYRVSPACLTRSRSAFLKPGSRISARALCYGLISVVVALVFLLPIFPGVSAARPLETAPDPLISQMVAQVDTATLSGYVADLSGERRVTVGSQEYVFETRYSYSEGITKAMQYLGEHYDRLGLEVAFQEYEYDSQVWQNVEATLPGLVHPETIYIVCAHADSTSHEPTSDAPGADDNASGAAAVMMAADILSTRHFEHTVRFVNFSGEEQGLHGSEAYAARSRAMGEDIAGVINLDMVGWDATGGPDFDLHSGTDQLSLSMAQTFSETVDLFDLALLPEIIDHEAISASDHGSFWHHGYPAILVIEDHHPNRNDFNPYYHTGADVLARMNTSYFKALTRAVVGTLATLAVPWEALPPTATATATPSALPLRVTFLPMVMVFESAGR